MDYHPKTAELIDRMCRYVERLDFTLEKERAQESILKTYKLFGLARPKKVVWCDSPWERKFQGALESAWSAWSAWSALDYDFDWFVIEHEYCLNPDKEFTPNSNDQKYLELQPGLTMN